MPYIWKKNVHPSDLTGAKVIGITLTTPGGKEGPIHKVTFDMKGRVTHQENTPEWGETFLTFPTAFKDLSDIVKWSCTPLKDYYYGSWKGIEQRVCVIELYTHKEISKALDKEMFEDIKKDLKERMSGVTDSRQPTGDDIRIAWLVTEVDRLNKEVSRLTAIAYPHPDLPIPQSPTN